MIIDFTSTEHYPLHELERYITGPEGKPLQGEISVYRLIKSLEDIKVNEKWLVIHDLRLKYGRPGKSKSQIDFCLITPIGVLLIEVKGGRPVFRNGIFLEESTGTPIYENPFTQAEELLHTVFLDKLIPNEFAPAGIIPFVSNLIIFPFSVFNPNPFPPSITDKSVILARENSQQEIPSLRFYNAVHERLVGFSGSRYDMNTMKKIRDILLGGEFFLKGYSSINRLYHELTRNIETVKGLLSNKRIIIEGPAGSGKTTFAENLILEKLEESVNNGQNHIIYLCYNKPMQWRFSASLQNLLAKKFGSDSIRVCDEHNFHVKNVTVTINTFWRFMVAKAGRTADFQNLQDKQNLILEAASNLSPEKTLLIFDETQEIADTFTFDFVDLMEESRILILIDKDQAYRNRERIANSFVSDLRDNKGFVHYRLSVVHRSIKTPSLLYFTEAIKNRRGTWLPEQSAYPENAIEIRHINNFIDLQTLLAELNAQMKNDPDFRPSNTLLLYSHEFGDSIAYKRMITNFGWNKITRENCYNSPECRCDSIFRAKGLDALNVVLFTQGFGEYNKEEMYVGASRAIMKLTVVIYGGNL